MMLFTELFKYECIFLLDWKESEAGLSSVNLYFSSDDRIKA
jgi:hypothetical protein